jgi:signal peptidase I
MSTPEPEQETTPTEATPPSQEEDVPAAKEHAEKRNAAAEEEEKARGEAKSGRGWLHRATEVPILVLLAFGIAVVIKTFLVQAFYIPSGSMVPTLQVGDRVLVEKVSELWNSPGRGDVVVFERDVFGAPRDDGSLLQDARRFFRELLGLPTGRTEDFIKRIVAVGGDKVRYAGSPRRLHVNGGRVDEPYINGGRDPGSPTLTGRDCKRLEMQAAGNGCRVPAGSVFVMGDNRGNSEDSRIIGPIEEDKIVGHAFLIIWPPGDFGTI